MATLTIRNLDDAVVEKLKARAKANDRSLEAEARTILAQASERLSRGEAIALMEKARAMTPKEVKQTPSLELLHEGREERDRQIEGTEKENDDHRRR
jgi:antitoxin FitA